MERKYMSELIKIDNDGSLQVTKTGSLKCELSKLNRKKLSVILNDVKRVQNSFQFEHGGQERVQG
jgi:hypothetical protein